MNMLLCKQKLIGLLSLARCGPGLGLFGVQGLNPIDLRKLSCLGGINLGDETTQIAHVAPIAALRFQRLKLPSIFRGVVLQVVQFVSGLAVLSLDLLEVQRQMLACLDRLGMKRSQGFDALRRR
nr:hypothetical protein [Thiomonas sp. X19]